MIFQKSGVQIRLVSEPFRVRVLVQRHIDLRHVCRVRTDHIRLKRFVICLDISDISVEILPDLFHREHKCTEILVRLSCVGGIQHFYKLSIHIHLCIAGSPDDRDCHALILRDLIVEGLMVEAPVQRDTVVIQPLSQKLPVISREQERIFRVPLRRLHIEGYCIRVGQCMKRRRHESRAVEFDHHLSVHLDCLSIYDLSVISVSAAVFYRDNPFCFLCSAHVIINNDICLTFNRHRNLCPRSFLKAVKRLLICNIVIRLLRAAPSLLSYHSH